MHFPNSQKGIVSFPFMAGRSTMTQAVIFGSWHGWGKVRIMPSPSSAHSSSPQKISYNTRHLRRHYLCYTHTRHFVEALENQPPTSTPSRILNCRICFVQDIANISLQIWQIHHIRGEYLASSLWQVGHYSQDNSQPQEDFG